MLFMSRIMSEFINIVAHIMFSIEEMAEINMFVICVCAYHMFIFVFKCIYLTNGYTSYVRPAPFTAGHWTNQDVQKQIILHNTIREYASDTFLLFFSYMSLNNADAVWNHVTTLRNAGVDWTKAGVAGHGYTAIGAMEDVANRMKQSLDLPSVTVTEYYPPDSNDQIYNAIFESHGMGWLHFEWFANDAVLPGIKYKFDIAGTIWYPDDESSDWPIGPSDVPPSGTSIGLYHRESNKFLSTYFESEVNADVDEYSGSSNDNFVLTNLGNNLVALQAYNGKYLSTPDDKTRVAASSSTIGPNEMFVWYGLANGDIALRSFGGMKSTGGGHLLQMGTKRHSGRLMANADDAHTVKTNFWVANSANPPPYVPPTYVQFDPCSDAGTQSGPYGGIPMSIPGRILAENFDYGAGDGYYDDSEENIGGAYRPCEGVDLQATTDNGLPAVNVGWFNAGEWLRYSVTVTASGVYKFVVRVAGGGSFHIEVDGVDKTGTVSFSDTGGWQNWDDVTTPAVALSAGNHMLKFYSYGGFNLNYIDVVDSSATTPPTSNQTPEPSPAPTPPDPSTCAASGQHCADQACCPGLTCSTGRPSTRKCE